MDTLLVPRVTLDDLLDRFDVILFDAYGVLAGSKSVVPGAPEAVTYLNDLGKSYYVLTNDASALPETTAARYVRMGLSIGVGRIITSGSLLTSHFQKSGLKGSRCVVLGTDDSIRYVEAAGGCMVSCAQEFDTLVLGDQSWPKFLETANRVLTALFNKIDSCHRVNLVLPNPDLIYPDGDGFGFASGTAAMMFESALALRYPGRCDLSFTRLGKPHAAIFEEAFRRSGTMDMVMIGDTPETDIRGANAYGIASVLVETGTAAVDASLLPSQDRPGFRMRSLALRL